MKYNKSTQCVHEGTIADSQTKGTVSPIYTSSAYDYLDVDVTAYPRYFNTPNQKSVGVKIAALENGEEAMVLSSGMAAISTALFSQIKQGDHVLLQNDLYGGTHNAAAKELNRYGIEYDFVNSMDAADFGSYIKSNTKIIYIETPSNPLLKLIDIEAIAQLAKKNNLITIIDNTFASPINQNPIDFGIDVVVHSGTKYLGGHSDMCCGAIVTSSKIMKDIWASAVNWGGSLNAQMCSLLERSIKTLALRVKQQNANAQAIASFLEKHDKVDAVYYPGLTSHPQYKLAKSQMHGFGGMLSFEVQGDPDELVKKLNLIPAAISLGGVESTITSPVQTSHSKMTDEARHQAGIKSNLLRLSVGIEEANDLMADLKQALG